MVFLLGVTKKKKKIKRALFVVVVVVDRARESIRCESIEASPAVCPARFLITPTTVVLRSSWGDKTPSGILHGRQFRPVTRPVDRLASNKSRTPPVSRSRATGSYRARPCHASENLFFFSFPPRPLSSVFVVSLAVLFCPDRSFRLNCGRWKDCSAGDGRADSHSFSRRLYWKVRWSALYWLSLLIDILSRRQPNGSLIMRSKRQNVITCIGILSEQVGFSLSLSLSLSLSFFQLGDSLVCISFDYYCHYYYY